MTSIIEAISADIVYTISTNVINTYFLFGLHSVYLNNCEIEAQKWNEPYISNFCDYSLFLHVLRIILILYHLNVTGNLQKKITNKNKWTNKSCPAHSNCRHIPRHLFKRIRAIQQNGRRNENYVAHNFVSSAGHTSRNTYLFRLRKCQRMHGRCLQNIRRAFETSQSKYANNYIWHQPIVWFSRSSKFISSVLANHFAMQCGAIFYSRIAFVVVVSLQLADLSCLVYQKSTNTYAPYNKEWIKEKIYVLLRQAAGTEASGSSSH